MKLFTVLTLLLTAAALLVPAGPAPAQADPTPHVLPPGAQTLPEAPLPTLWIIGDSTVKNGTTGLQGWGTPITALFDPAKIRVENRALGGRSSRTFRTEGHWAAVISQIHPGDFVLMQFGHNDGGGLDKPPYRASIKGNGDDTQTAPTDATGRTETVHSYGWYIRQYVADAKSKGATAIVLSPVPRNIWGTDGKVLRNSADYGLWAKEAAAQAGALFVDLNAIIADKYDAMGETAVKAFFPGDHTHTDPDGAALNARCVADGLRALPDCPLKNDLRPDAPE